MRFGICTSLQNTNRLVDIGYNYIELGGRAALMPEADEAEFKKGREQIAKAPLKPEAYAGFIPSGLRVGGDAVDRPRLSAYVETACRRATQIKGEVIIYGSSGSRRITEGYRRELALTQIAEFLDMAADHTETYDIIIAIEPICPQEGNILKTVADAVAMAKRVNRKSIKALADLYYVWQKRESMQNIINAAEWLQHVHIAEPVKRSHPGNDNFDFTDFFTTLQKAGYNGRVSCECTFDNFDEDIQTVLRTMRAYV